MRETVYIFSFKLTIFFTFFQLYGLSQMSKLPHTNFEWLTEKEIENFDVLKENLDGSVGFIVECDLHYPKKLHKTHRHLPLAPEIVQITYENLSPYAKQALLQSDGQMRYKDVKLVSSFCDRTNYICHGKNLKLYLDLGMKLTKISRILKFNQSHIFAPYITKCTEARQKSTTKFEMNQFKKMGKLKKFCLRRDSNPRSL